MLDVIHSKYKGQTIEFSFLQCGEIRLNGKNIRFHKISIRTKHNDDLQGYLVLYPICFDDEIFCFMVNQVINEFLISLFHAKIHPYINWRKK